MKDPIVKESIHTSKETKNAGRHYATITEVFDFGPHISKIILDTECELAGAVLSPSQFEVEVTRTSTLGEDFEWPQFMGAKPDDSMHGTRTITGLYISDADGNPAQSGTHITLEMYCHPMQGLGSIIRFDGHYNVSVNVDCVITQKEPLSTDAGILEGMKIGILDSSYEKYAAKAIEGICANVDEDGTVLNVSAGTGMGYDADHYKNIVIRPMAYGQSLALIALCEALK